jgi:large subunit ribosomal protein L29
VKAKEIRELTRDEIEQRLRESHEELFNLRFQHTTGQLNNPLRIREVRKDIARLTTILKEESERGGASEPTTASGRDSTKRTE